MIDRRRDDGSGLALYQLTDLLHLERSIVIRDQAEEAKSAINRSLFQPVPNTRHEIARVVLRKSKGSFEIGRLGTLRGGWIERRQYLRFGQTRRPGLFRLRLAMGRCRKKQKA